MNSSIVTVKLIDRYVSRNIVFKYLIFIKDIAYFECLKALLLLHMTITQMTFESKILEFRSLSSGSNY